MCMIGRMDGKGLILALAAAALAGGCQPAGKVSLVQPQLAGWQREVRLQTDQVYWARAEGVDRILAEFPLPGARIGRPTYLLYLRLPAGVDKAALDPKADPKSRARGFIIQTRGEYAGLAGLKSGEVQARSPSPLAPASKRLFRVDLKCEDGTQIVGEMTASRDDYLVSRFETRQRPADVQSLLRTNSAGATSKPK